MDSPPFSPGVVGVAAPTSPFTPPTVPPSHAAVEAWFAKHFHGLGPMLDTQVYNILYAAKDELLQVLAVAPHK